MMKPTMTRGELRVIADTDHVQCGDAAAMANMLLELLDGSPVYQVLGSGGWRDVAADVVEPLKEAGQTIRILYSLSPTPVTEEMGSSLQLRNLIRKRHAEWSQKAFGSVGPVGPLKHLAKEAIEAAEAPADLSEWADMQFLLWDAQRRAGISDAEITAAMEEKLKVNMERKWPEPKDGEPRLHIKP